MKKIPFSIRHAGIQTHDLQNVSLLPLPLDQGSHPQVAYLTPMLVYDRKLQIWAFELLIHSVSYLLHKSLLIDKPSIL